jgi:glycosyltransferase involved in cell wall biosynthesis
MSLRVFIIPETPAKGPLWVCAEVRLINPLTHPSVRGLVDATYGLYGNLPDGRIDVVVMQRGGWPEWSFEDAQNVVHSLRARGAKLVYDIDDDLLSVHPIRGIDVELARKRPIIRFLASEADLIICSTDALAARLAAWPAPKRVWRNALDERRFERRSTRGKETGRRYAVGYAGTPSHLRDLLSVTETLRSTLAREKDRVGLEFFGAVDSHHLQTLFGPLLLSAPQPATSYHRYVGAMQSEVKWDVAIAPLLACPFNISKSDIKFLEYSAFGFPGVYSTSHAYSSVVHNETGLLTTKEDFGQAILTLLDSPDLRRRIITNAYDYVMQERTLATCARELVSIINSAL